MITDIENVVKAWLRASPLVADLVPLPGNRGPAVYLSMPKSAPIPVVLVRMASTGPAPRKDIPEQVTRFSLHTVADSRDECWQIAAAIVDVLEQAREQQYSDGVTTVVNAQTVGVRWLPDEDSDAPRYVVEALITTVN